ncbi:flagellar hook-basal body complex protein FliE [Nocardioides nitrophenolicus]|uniref:flagellar hook-basal body complex protein FliE n=1 Tax=Nocardioides nitrophenolicus TaxID=60489 RepID=UPI0019597CCD|nr:flagellar hook-basal body complex protein FliE [Nocardioides nitrophenolicus]MBM7516406.1 flagellar hook-basal body complex protein FliE [Nocardioides nitrophenolicus]
MEITPLQFPSLSGADALGSIAAPPSADQVAPSTGPDTEFGSLVLDGLDRLEGLTDKADGLAVQAATGKLENIHDYTIAASEASVASQLTVSLRNRAVEAFNEIMRMQV